MDAVDRAAGYLARATQLDGMFEYRINMDSTVHLEPQYNILRHAGTVYAMATHYRLRPNDTPRAAIERAAAYLRNEAIGPVPGERDMLAVWSKPSVNRSGNPLQAKLGGTGLGLVALLSVEQISPGFTPLSELRGLGRFLVYMQKEDGSFYSKYIPEEGGRWDDWTSRFYPGEAALGLAMLYERDPADRWVRSAARALENLARGRQEEADPEADHWALLAAAKLLEVVDEAELPVSKELLVRDAVKLCESILREQVDDPLQPEFHGGFSEDGRTTPTATRLEGLLAARTFLPPGHGTRARIDSAVPRGIAFLLRAQVTEGEFAGAMPRSVGWDSTVSDEINRRATQVRIDYVQHALSAMIQYLQAMD